MICQRMIPQLIVLDTWLPTRESYKIRRERLKRDIKFLTQSFFSSVHVCTTRYILTSFIYIVYIFSYLTRFYPTDNYFREASHNLIHIAYHNSPLLGINCFCLIFIEILRYLICIHYYYYFNFIQLFLSEFFQI